MKKALKSIIVAVALSAFSLTPKVSVAQDQPITLQTFYDQLAPYGQWINYPNYGYVFIPNAGPGFVPYSTSGHWEYTDQFGWTWASDYPWGWACFHYGRWNYDPSYGWFWVPDTQWGPAWVVWRNSPQYYGWAPLPWGVDINAGINNGYGIPSQNWCFVSNQYMGDPYIYRYYVPRGNNDIYVSNSAIIFRMNYDNGHHYGFFAGPDRYEVERYRHSQIQPTVISFSSDPHQNMYTSASHQITFYRPGPTIVVAHDNGHHDDEHHDDGHHDDGHHDDGHHDDGHHDAPVRVVQVQQVPQRGYNPGNDNHGNGNNNWNNNHGNPNGNNGGNNGNNNNHGRH